MNINAILKAEITQEPFPHAHVKNLFDEEEFDKLSKFSREFIEENREDLNKEWSKQMKISKAKGKYPALAWYHNEWGKMGFDTALGLRWFEIFKKNKDNILSYFGQHRFGKKGYYTQLFFNFSPPKSAFPIHHDTAAKVWTIAYYLSPDKNSGTRLYDKQKKFVKEDSWELNSGCSFSPDDNASWHNYQNLSEKDWRCVLIINIMRKL